MLGSCECAGENICWDGNQCTHIGDYCTATELKYCQDTQKKAAESYEQSCPAECRPGYVKTEKEKKALESELCKHSGACPGVTPCFLYSCEMEFENMCSEVEEKCEGLEK